MTKPSPTYGASTGKIVIAAGVAVLALVALYLGGVIAPAPERADEPPQTPPDAAAVQSAPDTRPAPSPAPAPEGQAAQTPAAPQIDIFRLQPDGEALVAGQGAPGWTIEILVDGAVHAHATPGSDGKFATFLKLPHATDPRVLSLRMLHGDGLTQIDGAQQIVVAPAPAPVDLASAPLPAPQPKTAPLTTQAPPPPDIDTANRRINIPADTDPAPPPASSASPPPMVMMADADGAKILQSPTPAATPRVLSNVALDTISYSSDGDVQLAGRAAGQGSVRIYLDNRPISLSRIAPDGTWHTALPSIDTGIYTLRIDELTADGTVTSRVETPFKREDRARLADLQNTDTPNPELPDTDTTPQAIRVITVQPGNTLWAISRETYGEGILYVRVFEANAERIRNPDLIYPGQVFTLPD